MVIYKTLNVCDLVNMANNNVIQVNVHIINILLLQIWHFLKPQT